MLTIDAPSNFICNLALFYARELEIDTIDATIDIYWLDDSDEEADGWCSVEIDNNTVEILLRKDAALVLTTLAHEMVHARQYLRGKLRFGNNPHIAYWNNRRFRIPAVNDEKYNNLPWEREANELENELAVKFISDFT